MNPLRTQHDTFSDRLSRAERTFGVAQVLRDQIGPVDAGPGRPRRRPMRLPRVALRQKREAMMREADAVGFGDALVQRQRRPPPLLRCRRVAGGLRDVAEALDAVGLAEHVADLPVQRQRLLIRRPRRRVVGARERDVAEAADAVGLAEHGADLPVQRQRLLIRRPRRRVIGARERDVDVATQRALAVAFGGALGEAFGSGKLLKSSRQKCVRESRVVRQAARSLVDLLLDELALTTGVFVHSIRS